MAEQILACMKGDIMPNRDKLYTEADLILDASASVAVSRSLSDSDVGQARRFSFFFNPQGTSAVLLAEGANRDVPLRHIEAQYYNAILTKPELAGHLGDPKGTIRYSGSCRALSNKIPAHAAAILSSLVTVGIRQELQSGKGGIYIWTLQDSGAVDSFHSDLVEPRTRQMDDWTISVEALVTAELRQERERHLPSETGGVLLGIVDFEARHIDVVHHLTAPSDSEADEVGFERGVRNLPEDIADCCQKVMHQIRYVGEWHSHPRNTSSRASKKDFKQLEWLSANLASEGVPAAMVIVGEKNESITIGIVKPGEAA
jgi:hypothetical protein